MVKFIFVFGQGGDGDMNKRPKMARVLERYAEHCFITPDNPRFEKQNIINNQIIKDLKKINIPFMMIV